eukprot:362825-Chlamydomonas_euryale.AAC.9
MDWHMISEERIAPRHCSWPSLTDPCMRHAMPCMCVYARRPRHARCSAACGGYGTVSAVVHALEKMGVGRLREGSVQCRLWTAQLADGRVKCGAACGRWGGVQRSLRTVG